MKCASLARSIDGTVNLHDALDIDGVRLLPAPARNNLIRHGVVLLPEAVTPFRSVASLLSDIKAYIARYVDLTDEFVAIASAYVLL